MSHHFDCDAFLSHGQLPTESRSTCLSDMSTSYITHVPMSSAIDRGQSWCRHECHGTNAATDDDQPSHPPSSYEFNDTFTGQYQSADHSTNDYMDNLGLFVCDDFLEKDSRLLTKIIAEDTLLPSSNEATDSSSARHAWQIDPLTSTFQQHE